MATLVLPARTDGVPFYSFEVDLEDRSYAFELRWNERDAGWYLSVSSPDGTSLVSGRRVSVGASLLGESANEALPPGTLIAIDTTDSDTDPGRDELGSRVVLIYIESTGG